MMMLLLVMIMMTRRQCKQRGTAYLHGDLELAAGQVLVGSRPLAHVVPARAQHALHQEHVRDGVAHRLVRHVYQVLQQLSRFALLRFTVDTFYC
jgi:hypothetical protein